MNILIKWAKKWTNKIYITKQCICRSNMHNSNVQLYKVCVFNQTRKLKIQPFVHKISELHNEIGYINKFVQSNHYFINNEIVYKILFDYDCMSISDEIINLAYYHIFHGYGISTTKIQELKSKYEIYNHSLFKYIFTECTKLNIPIIRNQSKQTIHIGWGNHQIVLNEPSYLNDFNPEFAHIYNLYKEIGVLWFQSNLLYLYTIPNNNERRIPIISVTGTNGKTTTTTLCAHILRGLYQTVGKTTTFGVYVNDTLIKKGDCAGPNSAKTLLMDVNINACSFETALGGIRSQGLVYDYANVGILTNIGKGDHISDYCISKSIHDIIDIKMTVINHILPNGYAVINANDEHIDCIMSKLKHVNIFLFSITLNQYILQYIQEKLPVIYYHSNEIICLYNDKKIQFSLFEMAILENAPLFQIENVMASIAATISLDIPIHIIKNQLSLYENNIVNNPGRMNKLKYGVANIIIDYAHNTDAVCNICNYVSDIKDIYSKTLIMFGAAGDRSENVITNMIQNIYDTFDIIILFVDDETLRGRTKKELMNIMKKGLPNSLNKPVYYCYTEINSIDKTFQFINKESNHFALLLVDNVDHSIKYVMEKYTH